MNSQQLDAHLEATEFKVAELREKIARFEDIEENWRLLRELRNELDALADSGRLSNTRIITLFNEWFGGTNLSVQVLGFSAQDWFDLNSRADNLRTTHETLRNEAWDAEVMSLNLAFNILAGHMRVAGINVDAKRDSLFDGLPVHKISPSGDLDELFSKVDSGLPKAEAVPRSGEWVKALRNQLEDLSLEMRGIIVEAEMLVSPKSGFDNLSFDEVVAVQAKLARLNKQFDSLQMKKHSLVYSGDGHLFQSESKGFLAEFEVISTFPALMGLCVFAMSKDLNEEDDDDSSVTPDELLRQRLALIRDELIALNEEASEKANQEHYSNDSVSVMLEYEVKFLTLHGRLVELINSSCEQQEDKEALLKEFDVLYTFQALLEQLSQGASREPFLSDEDWSEAKKVKADFEKKIEEMMEAFASERFMDGLRILAQIVLNSEVEIQGISMAFVPVIEKISKLGSEELVKYLRAVVLPIRHSLNELKERTDVVDEEKRSMRLKAESRKRLLDVHVRAGFSPEEAMQLVLAETVSQKSSAQEWISCLVQILQCPGPDKKTDDPLLETLMDAAEEIRRRASSESPDGDAVKTDSEK